MVKYRWRDIPFDPQKSYLSPCPRENSFITGPLDSRFAGKIPVTFMTGFYVANVVSRYWDQFVSLPWPDRVAYKVVTFIPGKVIVLGCCLSLGFNTLGHPEP